MRIYYIIKMNTELLNKLLEYTIWMPIKGYENYEISIWTLDVYDHYVI